MTIEEVSLKKHREFRGKIEMVSKFGKVKNREDLSLAYTPGVARVSRMLSENPKEARHYSMKGNSVAVVSDGSAVLGLGNIGPLGALPVMEGKAVLFKEFAGVDAYPIVLATQDTEEIVKTVKMIAPTFGGINLEDISAPRCFEIEDRLKEELEIPVMHDDQHGTAVVVLAGIINALKVVKKKMNKVRVVISGAGAAGIAVANLLDEYGIGKLTVVDSKGIIEPSRQDLGGQKLKLIDLKSYHPVSGKLTDAVVGADVFVGVSAPAILDENDVRTMGERPIVFALANPVPEIMPKEAIRGGAVVVATGRSDFPNQINNVLAFPGIFRGALDNGVSKITQRMKMDAAEALAGCVSNEELSANVIIPSPFYPNLAAIVAKAVVNR